MSSRGTSPLPATPDVTPTGGALRTIAVALACVLACVVSLSPNFLLGKTVEEVSNVVSVYYPVVEQTRAGSIPYRDFPFEYPLLCVPFVLAPGWLAARPDAYAVAFGVEMLLINAMLIGLVNRELASRFSAAECLTRLAWYFACFFFLSRLAVTRLDLAPALLAFLSAMLWFRGSPALGGFVAGLGVLTKIFPGLVGLAGTFRDLRGQGPKNLRGLACLMLTTVVGIGLWWWLGGPGFVNSLRYHSERGIEIESVPAGLLLAFGKLTGWDYRPVFDHGSFNVAGPGSHLVGSLSVLAQGSLILITLMRFLTVEKSAEESAAAHGLRFTAALILALLVTSKVLSAQFFLWLLPFIVVMDGDAGRLARPVYLAICLLTVLLYPVVFFRFLTKMHTLGIAVLNLRNILTILLWWVVTFRGVGERLHRTAPALS